jgi:serine/threonine-protein kinase
VAALKITRFWPVSKRRRSGPAAVALVDGGIGLDAFGSEADEERLASFPVPDAAAGPAQWKRHGVTRTAWITGAVVVLIAMLGGGAYAYVKYPIAWPRRMGSVTVETVPAALEIFVNGKSVGKSPVTVALSAASYQVRLGAGDGARTVTIPVVAGASLIQHYELASVSATASAGVGTLRVHTEPARLIVWLDGAERGVSPLTLDKVAPGDHRISVKAEQGSVERIVHVAAGETTSVIIASTQAKPDANAVAAGWLTVASPIPLQVREQGHLLGTSDVEKLMLPSGDHSVDLVNDTLGYRVPLRVKIAPGKTTVSRIDVPDGTLSVNAQPWADVTIDGQHVGQTPIGNVKLPIGRHEVIFRHPDLGERKETVTVTLTQPVRLGVDLRKK